MGLRISTNMGALTASRNLAATNKDQAKIYSRLSSGQRITQAGDDAAGLEPKNTYVVSARITHGDQLLFISDKATPVITRGNPLEADLVLKKVSAKQ